MALDPRIKVLYIEGRARPEYRELSRALNRDPNVELATLLRIRQDRFTAGGSGEGEPFTKMPMTREQWKKFDVIILGDLDSSFLPAAQQASIEHVVGDGHRVHRRSRPPRHRLSHQGRAGRDRIARAESAGPGEVPRAHLGVTERTALCAGAKRLWSATPNDRRKATGWWPGA